jgi:hypothetical protein
LREYHKSVYAGILIEASREFGFPQQSGTRVVKVFWTDSTKQSICQAVTVLSSSEGSSGRHSTPRSILLLLLPQDNAEPFQESFSTSRLLLGCSVPLVDFRGNYCDAGNK